MWDSIPIILNKLPTLPIVEGGGSNCDLASFYCSVNLFIWSSNCAAFRLPLSVTYYAKSTSKLVTPGFFASTRCRSSPAQRFTKTAAAFSLFLGDPVAMKSTNGMILSTLSVSSHGFALGFPKRPHTNRDSIPHS